MDSKIHVQSFVNNISFPKSLEELYMFATEHGCFNVEDILYDEVTEWTAPMWAKVGDVVFFMHAKYAKSTITALRTELLLNRDKYQSFKYDILMSWIERGLDLHKMYGGKIYAIGIVSGPPEIYDDGFTNFHWGSRLYAQIDIVSILDNPIDISQFNDIIKISRQSGITPVTGPEFKELMKRISYNNEIPDRLLECDATPLPLVKINSDNWLTLSKEYRRSFLYEIQFRRYFVDYLLAALGDKKHFYTECRCIKDEIADSFVDNVILFNGKYLPVEVKLSILGQINLQGQVEKYCNDKEIVIDVKKDKRVYQSDVYFESVLIIDTDLIELYDDSNKMFTQIIHLDDLHDISDIGFVREKLIKELSSKISKSS